MADVTSNSNECIFSFYPSDVVMFNDDDYNLHTMFRASSFQTVASPYGATQKEVALQIGYKQNSFKYSDVIQFDEESNIYYIHLGSTDSDAKYQRLYFSTPPWKWPKMYTMLIWVKWTDLSTLTTFDSGGCVPIVGSGQRLAVDRQHDWQYLSKYTINLEEWSFIAAVGGDLSSLFYIGSLDKKPEFEERVNTDVSDQITYKIGNPGQGPGKVAMLKVYNYRLDAEQIEDEYYASRFEISLQWNDEQLQVIKTNLLKYVDIEAIVGCIITFSCYMRYRKNV